MLLIILINFFKGESMSNKIEEKTCFCWNLLLNDVDSISSEQSVIQSYHAICYCTVVYSGTCV